MRFLFPLSIAMVLGVGLFFLKPGSIPVGLAALKPTPAASPARAVPAKNTETPHAAAPRKRPDAAPRNNAADEPAVQSVAQTETAAARAPSAAEAQTRPLAPEALRQIAVGMDADEVVRLLGQPALTTLAIDRGAMTQAYVYRQTGGVPQVMIHLSDGRVRSAPRYETH